MQILVIEDDPIIGKAVRQGIEEAGSECAWVKDGGIGFEKAVSQQFDAIVLDLMLPGEHGLEVMKRLRNRGVRTPVLILTAISRIMPTMWDKRGLIVPVSMAESRGAGWLNRQSRRGVTEARRGRQRRGAALARTHAGDNGAARVCALAGPYERRPRSASGDAQTKALEGLQMPQAPDPVAMDAVFAQKD
jgi:hypothetical protein